MSLRKRVEILLERRSIKNKKMYFIVASSHTEEVQKIDEINQKEHNDDTQITVFRLYDCEAINEDTK